MYATIGKESLFGLFLNLKISTLSFSFALFSSMLPNKFPKTALYKKVFKNVDKTIKSVNLKGFCCSYISTSSKILKHTLLEPISCTQSRYLRYIMGHTIAKQLQHLKLGSCTFRVDS
jgi:hypothetical protein